MGLIAPRLSTMLSSINRFLIVCCLTLCLAGPASALCEDPRPRLVCAEYFASGAVVEATLLKMTPVNDKKEPDFIAAYRYSLRADTVLRGKVGDAFQVLESNDSGRSTFDWKVGEKYLLFLRSPHSGNAWSLDGCGNSGPLHSAAAALQEIDAIRKGHHDGGMIHGEVRDAALPEAPPTIHFVARGSNTIYSAKSNSQGEFELKVPQGRYSLFRAKGDARIVAGVLSYENPLDLTILPGGCVQVQLVVK